MSTDSEDKWAIFIIGLVLGMLLFVGLTALAPKNNSWYRNGQTDALTGKVHYELKKQKDGTTSWERKE